MSDRSSSSRNVSIAVTPMHRAAAGAWEPGSREGAQLFLVEVVQADGEDAEVVVECRDERAAALAARVAAATVVAPGLAEPAAEGDVEAFDEETAGILADHPTPEVEAPSGEWRQREEGDPDERSG
jgi:hypothetical protein